MKSSAAQLDLLDDIPPWERQANERRHATAPEPTDPGVIASDRPRLSGQNAAILDLLRQGPATNGELSEISLKYTSRISDLRKFLKATGETIVCDRGAKGVNVYRITAKQR